MDINAAEMNVIQEKSDSRNEELNSVEKFHDTRDVSNNSASSSDDHNEVCDVCEKGGDLLCCDTCSLVFHLGCLRPKMSVIPKGKWSCPHCIVDVSVTSFFLIN